MKQKHDPSMMFQNKWLQSTEIRPRPSKCWRLRRSLRWMKAPSTGNAKPKAA